MVWQAGSATDSPTRIVGTVNISVNLPQSGGTDGPRYPSHWGTVPDMPTPVKVGPNWLLTMYGDPDHNRTAPGATTKYNLVALTSPVSDGTHWRQLSLIKNVTGTDGTLAGPCSGASE
eukprot:SAG31_NODE_3601_length_4085_cov_1.880582_10_plen_117_part_01